MPGEVELIERFYAAFGRKDGDAMAACYAPDARFSDPVFGELRGE
jgi:ketosteroid isomerase-like protein